MVDIAELMEEMTQTLSDTANSEVVVGQTVELGSAKIVPLSKVSIGFGGGGGEGDQHMCHGPGRKEKSQGGRGKGSGAAGGAKVRPVAVIIFTEEGVKVERIPEKSGPLDKIFDKIPDLIEMAQKHKH